MEKKEQIKSSHFFDIIDCLLKQFLEEKYAQCVGKDFGEDIIPSARDYFTIAILREKLPDGFSFFSIFNDNTVYETTGNGITHTIFIDSSITNAVLFQPFFSIILAHQICHFAFVYESYINFTRNNGIINHRDFVNSLNNIISVSKDNINVPIIDVNTDVNNEGYNILDLIKKFGKYPQEHFTHGRDSTINYEELFNDLINHLNFMVN